MSIVLKIVKWFIYLVVISFSCWFLVSACKYRIAVGGNVAEVEGVVIYKQLEINLENRDIFESLMGKVIVRLDGHHRFYVSREDKKKLLPENPIEMLKKGYTIKAKIRSNTLFFGGVNNSEVYSIEIVDDDPIVRK